MTGEGGDKNKAQPETSQRDPRAAERPPWDALPDEAPVAVIPAELPGELPRVEAVPGCEALAGFLESDLQGGVIGVERLLEQIDRVERGEVGAIERCGNAYRLRLWRGLAVIQSLHDLQQPDCRIDSRLLQRVLGDWCDALKKR